ncbi:MAG: fucose isomerase [Solobacterium sp.]|jgi:L-fucose mutarotase|nr:fucose isomerase [Solobacterium sp.]MCH4048623.1 fucose isomerase [Solobacterium sp.]MCH4075686.1 fucose isomerase [Solobacterium sp.]
MLKGISPLISPELLKDLAEMGHGDTIVLGDCNYPAVSTGKRFVRADGVKATDLLDAILQLLPLDVDEPGAPVILMGSTDHPDMIPAVWNEFRNIVLKYEPKATFDHTDRFGFYSKAKDAFACVQTSEQQYFGCIILRKGPWFDKN